MRLLLVEDDELLGDAVRTGLSQEGYTVDWMKDGISAEAALKAEHFDLVVLDLGLPRRSGLEILKTLRNSSNPIPVLILTARDTVSDRVQGLDTGADDYFIKPFDMDELNARIRALLRRSSGRASPVLVHKDITLDPVAHIVTHNDKPVELSAREFVILQTLLENMGKVISKSRLEQGLYGWNMEVESNTVEVYIHHLRKKLGNDLIQTIRGVGYMITRDD
jgi:two-component system response regulator QseB